MFCRKINHKLHFEKLKFIGKIKLRGKKIMRDDITAITAQK